MASEDTGEILYQAERIQFANENQGTSCSRGDYRQFTEKRPYSQYSLSNIILCIVCALLFLCNLAQAQGCDYVGSGLHADGKGVRPAYLSCTSGKVQWDYPRGALRVVLTLPHSSSQFRACIKLSKPVEGARAFLEGHRTLLPIDSKRKSTKCFSSYSGRVVIYIEALPASVPLKDGASFEYHLEPYSGELYDPSEECRPCTDTEMVRHYCSSDFVAIGQFIREQQNQEDEMTVLTFSAERVLHQSTPVFSGIHSASPLPNDVEENVIEPRYTGDVRVPLHCDAQIGPDRLLVLGYIRLGDPMLKCGAKMKDWQRIAKDARNDAHCILEV